jgi:hypothetical protein
MSKKFWWKPLMERYFQEYPSIDDGIIIKRILKRERQRKKVRGRALI